MTDRHMGYIVTLEKDLREDDAENIIKAIIMIKGVLSVEPLVSDTMLHIATERVKNEIRNRLWEILK